MKQKHEQTNERSTSDKQTCTLFDYQINPLSRTLWTRLPIQYSLTYPTPSTSWPTVHVCSKNGQDPPAACRIEDSWNVRSRHNLNYFRFGGKQTNIIFDSFPSSPYLLVLIFKFLSSLNVKPNASISTPHPRMWVCLCVRMLGDSFLSNHGPFTVYWQWALSFFHSQAFFVYQTPPQASSSVKLKNFLSFFLRVWTPALLLLFAIRRMPFVNSQESLHVCHSVTAVAGLFFSKNEVKSWHFKTKEISFV